MMRIVRFIVFLCVLLLAACRQELPTETAQEKRIITFSLDVAESRATQEGTFENGDKIGVFVFPHGDTSSPLYTNVPYTYQNGIFVPSGTEIKQSSSRYDFFIYYPYSASNEDVKNIVHEVGPQPGRGEWLASDLLTATYKDEITGGNVPLRFSHKYGTVIVNIDHPSLVTKVLMKSVKYKSKTDLTTMTTTATTDTKDIQMFKFGATSEKQQYKATLPVQRIPTSNIIEVHYSTGKIVKISPDSPLTLHESTISKYGLNLSRRVTVNDYLPGGTTTGAGNYSFDTDCTLSVTPKSGYTFIGWYENNVSLSSETAYRFAVKKDYQITPIYENRRTTDIVLSPSNPVIPARGGSVTLTATVTKTTYRNGVATGTSSSTTSSLSITSNSPIFSVSGNTVTAGNNTGPSRTATLNVSYDGITKQITISQSGATTSYGAWEAVSASINPTSIPATGGSAEVGYLFRRSVKINGTHSHYETVTTGAGITSSNSVFAVSGNIVRVGNNTGSARNTTLTISYGGASKTVVLSQAAAVTTYGSWTFESATVNPTNLPVTGGSATVSYLVRRSVMINGVHSHYETVTTGAGITSNNSAFAVSGNTVRVGNNTGGPRNTTLTISYGGASKTVVLSQAAAVTTYGSWTFESATVNPTNLPVTGGSATVSYLVRRSVMINGVHSHYETVTTGASITSSNSAFAVSGNTVRVGNNTGSARNTTLTISYGGASKTVVLSQAAAVTTYGSWTFESATVNPTNLPVTGGSATVSYLVRRSVMINGVHSHYETVTTGAGITSSNSVFAVSGNIVRVGNNTGGPRNTTLTISYGGTSRQVNLSQSGAVYSYVFTWNNGAITLDENSDPLYEGRPSSEGSLTLPVVISTKKNDISGTINNIGYTVSEKPDWVTINGTTVSFGKNNSPNSRTAIIKLIQTESGKTITYTFTQKRGQGVVGN